MGVSSGRSEASQKDSGDYQHSSRCLAKMPLGTFDKATDAPCVQALVPFLLHLAANVHPARQGGWLSYLGPPPAGDAELRALALA